MARLLLYLALAVLTGLGGCSCGPGMLVRTDEPDASFWLTNDEQGRGATPQPLASFKGFPTHEGVAQGESDSRETGELMGTVVPIWPSYEGRPKGIALEKEGGFVVLLLDIERGGYVVPWSGQFVPRQETSGILDHVDLVFDELEARDVVLHPDKWWPVPFYSRDPGD